jgi:hypothetical protein
VWCWVTGDQLLQALVLYCQNFEFESSLYVGAPLALLGLARSIREVTATEKGTAASSSRRSTFGVGVTLAFAFYMVVFHSLSNLPLDQPLYFEVHKRFWMQAHIIAFALVGIGLGVVARVIGGSDAGKPAVAPPLSSQAVAAALTAILVSLQVT